MKKKCFFVGIFGLMSFTTIFAYETIRLTFDEIRSDGVFLRTRTVDAVFMGWIQHVTFLERDTKVTYHSFRPHNGEWDDWELAGRVPARLSLTRHFDTLRREYYSRPRMSVPTIAQGFETIRMLSIPDGRVSPFWWGQDGRSFYTFFRVYVVMP